MREREMWKEGLDPIITTYDQFANLHLGNSTASTSSDSEARRVMFADPCSTATKKRRLHPLQIIHPLNPKKKNKPTTALNSPPENRNSRSTTPAPPENLDHNNRLGSSSAENSSETAPSSLPQATGPFPGNCGSFSSSTSDNTPPLSAETSPATVPRQPPPADIASASASASAAASTSSSSSTICIETLNPRECGCCNEKVKCERNGDAYTVIHKCCCGKTYQILICILPH